MLKFCHDDPQYLDGRLEEYFLVIHRLTNYFALLGAGLRSE